MKIKIITIQTWLVTKTDRNKWLTKNNIKFGQTTTIKINKKILQMINTIRSIEIWDSKNIWKRVIFRIWIIIYIFFFYKNYIILL